MCLGILPARADPVRALARGGPAGVPARRRSPTCVPLKQILSGPLLKTTLAASLLATGIQGGYYAMFTWIPTYLKTERGPDRRGHVRLPVRGHRRRVLRLSDRRVRARPIGRRKAFALFALLAGTSLVAYFAGADRVEHGAADRRLPAGVLRVRLLQRVRLLPRGAVPDARPGHRRRLLLQRRPRDRGVVPGHHRLPRRRGRAGRRRSPSACSATCSRSPRCWSCRRPRDATSHDRRAARTLGSTTSSSPATPASPIHPAHEPGVSLTLHRRHEQGAAESRTGASALLVMAEHTGTHIDALCHQAYDGVMHGGVEATPAVQTPTGFTALGIDTVEPIVRRGVLFDVAPCCLGGRGGAGGVRRRAASRRRGPGPARLGRPVRRPGRLPGGGRRDRRRRRAGWPSASRSRSAPTTSPGTRSTRPIRSSARSPATRS